MVPESFGVMSLVEVIEEALGFFGEEFLEAEYIGIRAAGVDLRSLEPFTRDGLLLQSIKEALRGTEAIPGKETHDSSLCQLIKMASSTGLL